MQSLQKTEESRIHSLESIGHVLLGTLFLTLASYMKIPFYPVSFSLHTFAVFWLALVQKPKHALWSTLCYLLCGTLGLPVFGGSVRCLWFLGKTGGYYIAFPIVAYAISKMSQKGESLIALLYGECVILALGYLWLIPFFGAKIAWSQGVLLFLPSDALKLLAAYYAAKAWKKWVKR